MQLWTFKFGLGGEWESEFLSPGGMCAARPRPLKGLQTPAACAISKTGNRSDQNWFYLPWKHSGPPLPWTGALQRWLCSDGGTIQGQMSLPLLCIHQHVHIVDAGSANCSLCCYWNLCSGFEILTTKCRIWWLIFLSSCHSRLCLSKFIHFNKLLHI